MKELIITDDMRRKINDYLGYELIKRNEIGHHIYDEAPGLGKIGIEGNEQMQVVTNKQLDMNGNVEWYKNPNPMSRPGKIKPFHCKLTTVSAKKAKILIASLFPEEEADKNFLHENREAIEELRRQFNAMSTKGKRGMMTESHEKYLKPRFLILGPNELFLDGALYYSGNDKSEEIPEMLFGPNEMHL